MPTPARRRGAVLAALCLATLTLSAATGAQSPGATAPPASGTPGQVRVEGAWARTSPMMGLAGAVFLVLVNDGPADDALVSASTPLASTAELHQTTTDAAGVMAMAPVPEIPVPAGGRTELAPGGYHVMLIGLAQPLLEGESVPLTLAFRSGTIVEVRAAAPGASGMPMGSDAAHGSPMPPASPGM